MWAAGPTSAVFLTDTPETIREKVNKHAFSGGRETRKEQQKYGADLDVDVSYQWLRFFLEDDDKLEDIAYHYANGGMMTGTVKKVLIDVLVELVTGIQERRAALSDEEVERFFTVQ